MKGKLDPSVLKIAEDFKRKKSEGESLDPIVEEALSAIDIAGEIIDSIAEGKRVDLAFFKLYMNHSKDKMGIKNSPSRKRRASRKERRKARKSKG